MGRFFSRASTGLVSVERLMRDVNAYAVMETVDEREDVPGLARAFNARPEGLAVMSCYGWPALIPAQYEELDARAHRVAYIVAVRFVQWTMEQNGEEPA
jgi:hypothetical protein